MRTDVYYSGEFCLAVVLFIYLILLGVRIINNRSTTLKNNWGKEIMRVCFAVYGAQVVKITLFPIMIGQAADI